jgi:hypothetical protein
MSFAESGTSLPSAVVFGTGASAAVVSGTRSVSAM